MLLNAEKRQGGKRCWYLDIFLESANDILSFLTICSLRSACGHIVSLSLTWWGSPKFKAKAQAGLGFAQPPLVTASKALLDRNGSGPEPRPSSHTQLSQPSALEQWRGFANMPKTPRQPAKHTRVSTLTRKEALTTVFVPNNFLQPRLSPWALWHPPERAFSEYKPQDRHAGWKAKVYLRGGWRAEGSPLCKLQWKTSHPKLSPDPTSLKEGSLMKGWFGFLTSYEESNKYMVMEENL